MLIPLSAISVGERQRKTIESTPLAELRESILARGLIHAVLVQQTPTGFDLVAGERRTRAITQISEAGLTFMHNLEEVPVGMIPVTLCSSQEEIEQLYLELEENEVREDLSWQDRDRALYSIHQLELQKNPNQTYVATAKKILAIGGAAQHQTVSTIRHALSQANIVAAHLDDPTISKARNSHEAYAIILQREAAAINAERLRRLQSRSPGTQSPHVVLCGDAYQLVPGMDAGRFNLILTDPPYGAGAGAKGFRDRTVHHHNYKDTPEDALKALQFLLVEGWRVLKPIGNIFIFGHVDYFPFFKEQCSTMGWKPFPVPIIWRKSQSEGLAPWGRSGFRRTYECIFYAEKGGRGLLSSPVDVLEVKRVHRSERIYAAQKPIDLLSQLIEASTLPGESVLDPFLGSGSTLVAAKRLDRVGTGIEQDKQIADIALDFIHRGELDDRDADE